MGVPPTPPGTIALPDGNLVRTGPDPREVVALVQFLATVGIPVSRQMVLLLQSNRAHLIPPEEIQSMSFIREAVVREWTAFAGALRALVTDAVMVLPVPSPEGTEGEAPRQFGVLRADGTFTPVTVTVALGDPIVEHPYRVTPVADPNARPS